VRATDVSEPLVRRHHRGDQHQRGGRHDAAHPAPVELDDRDRAGAFLLAHEKPGDQKAGDHEEHVDAEETAGQTGYARVVEHDQQDGESAKSLDVGAEAAAGLAVGVGRRGHLGRCCGNHGTP
jgi:hypothetical protein